MRMPRGLTGRSMVFISFLTIGLNGIVWSGLSVHVEGPKKVANFCIYNCVLCSYLYFCICLLSPQSVDAGTCTWRGNKAVNAVGSQTRPWAHLLPSRILHSNLQQGWRRLSNLLQVQTCVRHCWLFSAWLPDHHDSQNMQHSTSECCMKLMQMWVEP